MEQRLPEGRVLSISADLWRQVRQTTVRTGTVFLLEKDNYWMNYWDPGSLSFLAALEGYDPSGSILLQETPHLSLLLLYHKSVIESWKLLLSHDWIDDEESSEHLVQKWDFIPSTFSNLLASKPYKPSCSTLSPERGPTGD